jgi:autotransporter adhesin
VGANAAASGDNAAAYGNNAAANGNNSAAIGNAAIAQGKNSLAAGNFATANGTNAIAVGSNSGAADNAVAVGYKAVAKANSVAIGSNASALNANSVALGAGSTTTVGARMGYTAYGLSAPQTSTGEVNIGGRTITGLAAGTADTDAVNVSQLKAVSDQSAAAIAAATTASDGAVKYDTNSDGTVDHGNVTLEGTSGTAIHNVAAGVDTNDAVNVGQLNEAIDQVNANIGDTVNDAVNAAVQNISVGATNPLLAANGDVATEAASATGDHSVALGANAVATGSGSVATGAGAQATADNAVAVGVNALASGTSSVANGAGAQATADNALAYGANSVASGTDSVANGAGARATAANTLAVGANAVAAGTGSVATGAGAQASANNSVALGQNSVADRANTVSVGAAGSERQITNVAAGTQGTDAANVNQLNQSAGSTLKSANDYTDSKTEGTRRDAYAGTASALAVAGLPQAVLPGRGMVALGGGTYGGQSAVAIGVSQLSENGIWAYKVSGTTSTRGQFGVSVGAGMHW